MKTLTELRGVTRGTIDRSGGSRGRTSGSRQNRRILRVALLIVAWLACASTASATILGMDELKLDFTSTKKLDVTWSNPTAIKRTSKGLGWEGQPYASHDGWILTGPISVGTSWRPARSVNVRVAIAPAPTPITLPNGQRYTPWPGRVFVRFSADRKYWSSWQSLSRDASQEKKEPTKVVYGGEVAVPRRAGSDYRKRLQAYMRRDVPWKCDEEALVNEIVARDKAYFRDHHPFVGYIQVLYELSFQGGRRITRIDVRTVHAVSGLHIPPKNKNDYNGRNGTWRFVHPSLRKP
ncbi:MAG: hypothetical protein KC609_04725 [Myxococcales bacterium]|nr:hypothetical protein [Myxococcales bacterium]